MISPVSVGEPAPWFPGKIGEDAVTFDELAGRYNVLFFFGSAARPGVVELLAKLGNGNGLFDGNRALFLGISNDPEDVQHGRLSQRCSGQRFVLDPSGAVSQRYGLTAPAATTTPTSIQPIAFILSPTLQIIEAIPWSEPSAFLEQIVSRLNARMANPPCVYNAPVLVVPQVFDRSFCRQLIDLYDSAGGREIGTIEKEGKLVERFDPKFRKRLDYYISDDRWIVQTRTLLERRLLPMVFRAFQFQTTRIERYLVGCYDAETGGYFRPHRDNTAPVVAHRRFAVTINLNEDYEGGYLRFPEFGGRPTMLRRVKPSYSRARFCTRSYR